jgi:protein TonB
MTALASYASPIGQLNWPRIGALSGSLSMHLFILALLLTPPIAMQLLKRTDTDTFVVHVIPKPPEVVPEPPPPNPVHRETPPRATPRVTPVRTVTIPIEPTNMPVFTPDPIAPIASTAAAPVEVAPTALAYGSSTHVPYPREALLRREQGTVILRVLVGSDGIPQRIEIETSSGSPRLDAAARDAVKHWSFRPGTSNGAATSAWARVPIAFNLTAL